MLEGIKNPQTKPPLGRHHSRPVFPVFPIPCICWCLLKPVFALNLWEAGIWCSLLVACIAGVSYRLVFGGFFLQWFETCIFKYCVQTCIWWPNTCHPRAWVCRVWPGRPVGYCQGSPSSLLSPPSPPPPYSTLIAPLISSAPPSPLLPPEAPLCQLIVLLVLDLNWTTYPKRGLRIHYRVVF